jgi:Uma2 family endonuclease
MTEAFKLVKLTAEEYLEREQQQETRNEFIDGQIFAMVGTTMAHNRIAGNVYALLHAQVRGTGCTAFVSDMKVKLENRFYYPDVLVSCERFDGKKLFVTEPVLIIEVLSDSTAETDRREKLTGYQQPPSLQCYLLVAQNDRLVTVYRKDEGGNWLISAAQGGECLDLPGLPCGDISLPLGLVYEGVF